MKEMTLKEIQSILGYEVKIIAEKQTKRLSDMAVGETFKLGDLEFIVLEHNQETTSVILKDFWKSSRFDNDSNNYAESEIRKDLNYSFYNKLALLCDEENIIMHKVDLTSDDGRKEYDKVYDKVSLLTCDLYRKYVEVLDKYNPKKWWWLATPYSVKSNGYSSFVRCVDFNGTLCSLNCNSLIGVRPFCILNSLIFVS